MRSIIRVVLLAACAASPLLAFAADTDPAAPAASGLGVRQQRVQRLMKQLEDKLLSLTQTLAKTEPERAARLEKTLIESKQLSLEKRMAVVAGLLDGAQLDKATDEQKKVLKDLERLAEVLLGEDQRKDNQAELERLERWKGEVQRLLDEQRAHLNETAKMADKDKALADLQQQIAAVEKLIARQQELADQTGKNRQQGIDGLAKLADKQQALRDDTQQLAKQVAGSQAGEQQGGQQGMQGGMQGGQQGGMQGGQQGGMQGGQQGGMQGGMQGNQPDPSKSASPAAQKLNDAAGRQQEAEKKLGQGRGKAGQEDQKAALAKLAEALDALKQEKARIASLPPDALNKLADKQGETADKTRQLGDEIAKAGQQGGMQGGQQGGMQGGQQGGMQGGMQGGQQGGMQGGQQGGMQGGQQPAQQPIQDAQQQMKDAGKKLSEQQPAEAEPPAAKAVDQLKKALQEIEDRLAQLREDERLEKLARLETRFREMLTRQQAATIATAAVEMKRKETDTLRRAEIIQLGKLSEEERALAEMASQALDILRDEGTSVVFPRIVERLHGDLAQLGLWLEQKLSGGQTHATQLEAESTLEELIAALKEAQKKAKEKKQSGGGGGGGGGEQEESLLPKAAELKLLRSAQLRVNRMTAEVDKRLAGKPLDDAGRSEVHRISERQSDISAMTDQILQRK
ncbi:MAG: hypothetical protein K8T25_03650 [Planctomycetia bacterium]|nr:hypothetical protein [Planctomycetia bacterium]